MNSSSDDKLSAWGKMPDADFLLADALWDLAALEKSPSDITAAQMIVAEMLEKIPEGDLSLQEQRALLQSVIHHDYGFNSSPQSHLPENINLASVVERKDGLPIALAVLYGSLAYSRGWSVQGINFPGHFLIQLGQGQQRLLVDPVNGNELQAHDLRRILKDTFGVHAELQHNHYQTVDARQWVVRYYNNQKSALINQDRLPEALVVARRLLQIAPYETRLYYDAAVMATRLEQAQDAIEFWEKFILLSDDKAEKEEAKYILSRLREKP